MLAVRANWRDAAGPIGALVAFVSALHVAAAVMQGEGPATDHPQDHAGSRPDLCCDPAGCSVRVCGFGAVDPRLALHNGLYARQSRKAPDTICAICYAVVAVHAAMAIAYSGNLMVLFIFYEILTFSTYPLVTHKETKEAVAAGRLYMGILVGTSVVLLLPAMIWVWY